MLPFNGEHFFLLTDRIRNRSLTEIPGYAPPNFGIGKLPADCSLITGVHTRAALDTVFNLKVHLSVFVFGVAVSRTDIGCTLMRTCGVTDIRIYLDVGFDL
jgi:hypothetical protein